MICNSGQATMKIKAMTEQSRSTMRSKAKAQEGGATDWHYNDIVLSEEYFRNVCGLCGTGADAYKEFLVPIENLITEFGEKSTSNGFKMIPKTHKAFDYNSVMRLASVVDGHEGGPVNGRITVSFARGLYLEYIMKEKVNWAKFAHEKHLNQCKLAWRKGGGRPTEAPFIRTQSVFVSKGAEDNFMEEKNSQGSVSPLMGTPTRPMASRVGTHQAEVDGGFARRILHAVDAEIQNQELKLKDLATQISTLKGNLNKYAEIELDYGRMIFKVAADKASTEATVLNFERELARAAEERKEIVLDMDEVYTKVDSTADPDDPAQIQVSISLA